MRINWRRDREKRIKLGRRKAKGEAGPRGEKEKKKGKSDRERRDRQQETKINVIIPSSVRQRAF